MADVLTMKKAAASSRFTEVGSSGLSFTNGQLETEFLRELRGTNAIKVYREMSRNDAVVGASLFAYTTLSKEVTFRVDSAEPGNAQADEVAEFIRGALFDDMSITWSELLTQIFSFLTYGWSFFEVVYKQRHGAGNDPTKRSRFNDGKIGWRKWAVRSQESLSRWDLDESGGVQGMVQTAAPTYAPVIIPIEKALLFRVANENGSPEGLSILRTAYMSFYYKRRLQQIRGIGVERDLAGLPIITPPQGVDLWNAQDPAAATQLANAERIVRNIRRDEHEGVVKPFGWTLELLSSGGGRQFDITGIMAQLNAEMTMSMLTDFLLIGHEAVGARSLSEDKRDLFSHALSAFLDSICDVINRFAIPKLVALNGWDEALTPTLAHGPVAPIGLAQLTAFITAAAGGGLLFPDEGLEAFLRERAQLPPAAAGARGEKTPAEKTPAEKTPAEKPLSEMA